MDRGEGAARGRRGGDEGDDDRVLHGEEAATERYATRGRQQT